MSLTSSLQRIVQAKADIKTAIEAKGVTVGNDVSIADYDDYIDQITGGGGGTLTTKNITTNGTYDAEDDGADGYSSVTVNVQVEVPEIGSISYDPATFTLSWTAPLDESGLALLQQYGYTLFYKVVREAVGGHPEHSLETTDLSAYVGNMLLTSRSYINTLKVLVLLRTSTANTTQNEEVIYPYSIAKIFTYHLSSARRSCTAVDDGNGTIYLFGGFNYTNEIAKFVSSQEALYSSIGTMPISAYGMAGANVGTDIYLFGGYMSSGAISTIYKYDISTGTMTTLNTTLPSAMMGASAVAVNTKIYIFGGWKTGGALSNAIYEFDTTNNTITTLSATLPTGTYDMGAAKAGNYIYLFGGWLSGYALNTIVRFDITNKTTSTISAALPNPTYGMGAAYLNGYIYAMGGIYYNNNSAAMLYHVYLFNPSNESIIQVISSNNLAARMGIAPAQTQNAIYWFGGMTTTSGNLTTDISKFYSSLSQ